MTLKKDGITQVNSGGGGAGSEVALVDGFDPLLKATVFDYPGSNPLSVQLVDSSGNPNAPIGVFSTTPLAVYFQGNQIAGSIINDGQANPSFDTSLGVAGTVFLYIQSSGLVCTWLRALSQGFFIKNYYNMTDDTIDTELKFDKIYQIPASGLPEVGIYCFGYVSGSADYVMVGGSGPIDMPKKVPLTPSGPIAVSVGVASTPILAANPLRKSARVVNTSGARVSLAFGVPAVLDSGMTLYPGGSFNMDEHDFNLAAINGIASAAASNVGAQEFV